MRTLFLTVICAVLFQFQTLHLVPEQVCQPDERSVQFARRPSFGIEESYRDNTHPELVIVLVSDSGRYRSM